MGICIPSVNCKSPCVKFQIVKSDFSNPSSENEIPPRGLQWNRNLTTNSSFSLKIEPTYCTSSIVES